jgi:hypothetical protein
MPAMQNIKVAVDVITTHGLFVNDGINKLKIVD